MSDYMAAEIRIGGSILQSTVAPLCDAICQQNVSLEWGDSLFVPTSAVELLDACQEIDGVKLLRLCDDQATWGEFDELEEFLQQRLVSYRRHRDGKFEHDSEVVEYRSHLGLVRTLASKSSEELVPLQPVREAESLIEVAAAHFKDKRLDAGRKLVHQAVQHLQKHLPPVVPPLQHFEIRGVCHVATA